MAYGQENKCTYDNMNMVFTGNTKTEWGKLAKEYKCPSEHVFWVVEQNSYQQQQQQRPNQYNLSPKCQYDDMDLNFTGNTKTEEGILAKEYKCPSGHRYWLTD